LFGEEARSLAAGNSAATSPTLATDRLYQLQLKSRATRIVASVLTGPRTSLVIVPGNESRVLSFISPPIHRPGSVKPYLTKIRCPCAPARYVTNPAASLLADFVSATG
jgi:hypothetical protein